MKYKVKFSGEFEVDMGPGRLTTEELEKAKQTVVAMNPIMLAPGAKLEITPVNKLFKVSYKSNSLYQDTVEAPDVVSAARLFRDRFGISRTLEEIEEAE